MQKRIVCFWAGPGTGKTTTASIVFGLLKKAGFNAEVNLEYTKDWVWEGRNIEPGDQSYIFAKQSRKERIYMKAGVDFIVTDCPMALSILYGRRYDKYEQQHSACSYLLKQHHEFCKDHGYKVEHIYLVRKKEYNPAGRLQTEDQAKVIDGECRDLLKELNINFKEFDCDEDVEDKVLEYLISISGK